MTEVPHASNSPRAHSLLRRWWVWWLASMIVLLVLGSISFQRRSTNSTSEAEASAVVIEAPTSVPSEVLGTVVRPVCVPAGRAALDAVMEARVGSDVTIQRGFVVEIVGDHVTGTPAFVLAAKLMKSGAPDQLGTWGMGTAEGGAPLWALNKAAQNLTSWLASADIGSAEDQARIALAASPEAAVATRCATL